MTILHWIDPVMRVPLLGTILISISLALIGTIFFLRKESLLGESLSHAAYPGVLLGSLLGSLGMLLGGIFSSAVAYGMIYFLIYKKRVSSDSALLFVLSTFFGLGILIASKLQFSHPKVYQSVFGYLYGQSALINSDVVRIYSFYVIGLIFFLLLFFHPLRIVLFDRTEASLHKIPIRFLQTSLFLLLIVSIVFGIRNVGIVLLSGMLIAPVVAARQWTHNLGWLFLLSAVAAMSSSIIGALASFYISYKGNYLPLGPSVILSAVLLAFISLLIAPKKGFLFRWGRMALFRTKCLRENIIKTLHKEGALAVEALRIRYPLTFLRLRYHLYRLIKQGFVKKCAHTLALTTKGHTKAISIIRLHRLWELFLTDQLGVDKNKVHSSAEEMEHILTKEMEKRLDHLLENPTKDPHEQPIPPADHG